MLYEVITLIDTLFSSNPSEDETLLNQDYMAAYAISNGLGPLAYVQSSPQLQLSGFTSRNNFV